MRKFSLLFAVLTLSTPAKADELLSKAVEKLIIDVHNLKLKVAELEAKINTSPSPTNLSNTIKHNSIEHKRMQDDTEVIRGKLVKSRESCRLATVKKVTEKGKQEILSLLPPEAPLYVRKFRGNYVYLTLPEYCEAVKEKIKDASITRIHIK